MVTQNPALLLILAFLIIVLVRIMYYQVKLRSIEGYRNKYQSYIDAISKDANDWESGERFAECQSEIIKLFEQAELSSSPVPVFEDFPLGNNLRVQTGTAQAWDNLAVTEQRFVASNRLTIHAAIGYFRARRNETVSIVYWVELVVFHPRKIVAAFGGSTTGVVANVTNIVALIGEVILIYEWFIK